MAADDRSLPLPIETLADGESIHLTLLSETPSQEALTKLQNFPSGVDQYAIKDKVIYLFLRQKFRDSKLPVQLQKLGVSATIRIWKTTMKLATIAKEME